MRVLYIPMYSNKYLINDTSYNWAKIFFSILFQKFKDVFLYMLVPEKTDMRYLEELVSVAQNRIYFHEVPYLNDQYLENTRIYAMDFISKFDEFNPEYYADIIVCDRPILLPYILFHICRPISFFNVNRVIISKMQFLFEKKYHTIDENIERAQFLGYLMSDIVEWGTEGYFNRAVQMARKYFSASSVDLLYRSKEIAGYFSNNYYIDRFYVDPRNKPKEPIVLNWAYGLNSSYSPDIVFKFFDYLYSMGLKVKIVITAPGRGCDLNFLEIIKKKYKYFEIYFGLSQEEYIKKLRDYHVFAIFSKQKGVIHSSVIEQMLMGLVGIFNKESKFVFLKDDYPFVYNDVYEAVNCLKYIVNNYFTDKIQKIIQEYREILLHNYNPLISESYIWDKAVNILNDKKNKFFSHHRDLINRIMNEVFSKYDSFDIYEFKEILKRDSISGKRWFSPEHTKFMGIVPMNIISLLDFFGFKDVCDSAIPRFVRVSNEEKKE